MVLAPSWTTTVLVCVLVVFMATVSAIWNSDSYPEDDYKYHFRERYKPTAKNESLIRGRHRLHRNRTHPARQLPAFSRWSDWGNCNSVTCTQTRNRLCLRYSLCHGSMQTETKSCGIEDCVVGDMHKERGKFDDENMKENQKTENHNHSLNNTYTSETAIGTELIKKKYNHQPHRSRKLENKRYEGSLFRIIRRHKSSNMVRALLPGRTTRGFSKWSLWSPCSKQCLTVRRRKCMRRRICGRNVIRETAYCYIDNSDCQEWVRNKIQDSKTKFIFETISSSDMAKMTNDLEQTNIVPHGVSRADKVQCGVLYGNKSLRMRSNLWSMMRIIGGRPAPKGKWIWQVVILNRFKEAFCGGTLISLRWVLTAAHCVRKRLYVRIGEYSLSIKDENEVEMQIREAIIHPLYNPETVDNDVAMLRLPRPAYTDRGHGIACLPHYHQPLPSGRLCTIIGWGKRRSTDYFGTDTLQEAEVPIIPMETCRSTYIDYYITHNMFCAGYRRGRMDSCAGDSGGPLLCKDPTKPGEPWTIYGITSFGDGCGKRGKYGIYTRLPNYVNWINKVLKITYFRD